MREGESGCHRESDPALYEDYARAKPVMDRQRAAKDELAGLYSDWESAQQRLAAIATDPQ